jgi:hypothetical protein
MGRIREQQKGLKDSLNKTITAGLEDIRDRLTQISVKEIIAQVPETFRQDLESEFSASLQTAINRINNQLQEKDVMNEYLNAIKKQLRAELQEILPSFSLDRDFQFSESFTFDLIYREMVEATDNRDISERVARRVTPRILERFYDYYFRAGRLR